MGTKANEVDGKLKGSEEHVQFLEESVAEQSNALLTKDSAATRFQEQMFGLEKKVADLSADVNSYRTQNATENDLLEGTSTTLDIQNMDSKQRTLWRLQERDKLKAEKVAIKDDFAKFWAKSKSKIDQFQVYLEGRNAQMITVMNVCG